MKENTPELPGIVRQDDWLRPATAAIEARRNRFVQRTAEIARAVGYHEPIAAIPEAPGTALSDWANAHLHFGLHRDPLKGGWWFREWLPGAREVFLFGDWNEWERTQFPLERNEAGEWSVFIPDEAVKGRLRHGSLVKMYVHGADGSWLDRIPAYIRRVVQDERTKDYAGQVWHPAEPFDWQGDAFDISDRAVPPIIYECHVGMSGEQEGVSTYAEFTRDVLPRIVALGYNTVQLMAVAEHPYYGSFGYHVSNFFAPSSRFGTPEELKELVRTSHAMGLAVVMDVVHSHYVKNVNEGLNRLDGTDTLYSPATGGDHPQWDSRLFDYGRHEVQHFLLSNIKYWLTEFRFDGFRFDGVSSMLYHHHGLNDHWDLDAYFGPGVNHDAVLYLSLANTLAHSLDRGAVTIAEDVSGMPGIAATPMDGGLGFDYRLGMAIPDFWIEYLKDVPDEQWSMNRIWSVLNDRLPQVPTIAYAESHDQALVGDKTIAFRLMDKEMYFAMSRTDRSLVVERGMALHKMIRLATITLGGEGYLNFMGNEFGHPEWIDFPREGNGWSYSHARRQWSLSEDEALRYADLLRFDKAMIALVRRFGILQSGYGQVLNLDEGTKTMVYEQGGLVFVLNWHTMASVPDYIIPVPVPGRYRMALCSDHPVFGGIGRLEWEQDYFTFERKDADGVVRHYMKIYNINRAAMVFERKD